MTYDRRRPAALGTLLLTCAFIACDQGAPGSEAAPSDDAPAAGARPLPEGAQAFSLFGEPLYPNPAPPEVAARQAEDIAAARADHDAAPDDADAIIWLGRRIAYTGLYREAIDVYSEGIAKHPGDARMYRHRGHRWISGLRML